MKGAMHMRNAAKAIIYWMAAGVCFVSLTACQKQETAEKGPAEKAGQQIDQAATRAGEELNKAAEKVGKGLQEFGQKIQNAAEDTQDSEKKE